MLDVAAFLLLNFRNCAASIPKVSVGVEGQEELEDSRTMIMIVDVGIVDSEKEERHWFVIRVCTTVILEIFVSD